LLKKNKFKLQTKTTYPDQLSPVFGENVLERFLHEERNKILNSESKNVPKSLSLNSQSLLSQICKKNLRISGVKDSVTTIPSSKTMSQIVFDLKLIQHNGYFFGTIRLSETHKNFRAFQ